MIRAQKIRAPLYPCPFIYATLGLCFYADKKTAVKYTAATWELLETALLIIAVFHKLVIFITFIIAIAVIEQGAQAVGKGFQLFFHGSFYANFYAA
ncbi:hypothetical protein [Pseudoalteromonas sp. T1lg75]|uniref:hypothetical protein n=1 Tax=Pseudoalteromonas sp. T1lg75 TaxID=2077102 RepID=UPI002D77824D|nr:hypothetical protein [Pseudoalteromonas sp. T1lg75]